MKITLVVAMARNRVIGRDNALPWHLPEDLKRFRALTMGKPIVMGRRTFASIGKALPGRTSIVISRQPGLDLPAGVLLAASVPDALVLARGFAPLRVRELREHGVALDLLLDQRELDALRQGQALAVDVGAADPALRFSFLTFDRVHP